MKRLILAFAATFALASLAGCASMVKVNRDATNAITDNDAVIHAKMAQLHAIASPPQLVSVSELPYVDADAVKYVASYPAVFNAPAALNTPAQSVWALMENLSRISGYHVTADDDLLNDAGATAAGGSRHSIDAIAYQGTLKGLLDTIAGELDAAWKYDAQARTISFYRYETRVFHIATVPGDGDSSTDLSTENGGVSGGQGQSIKVNSTTGAKLKYTAKTGIWATLKDNITPMLSKAGNLAISEPTASITVRDRWDHINKIAEYVDSINKALSMQVLVNVTVYRVVRAHNDNRGFNWSVLYNALAQRASQFGLTINTPRPTDTGLSSLILSSPKQSPNGTTVPFAGSQAFVDALNTVGDTSVITQSSVVTVNNVPTPFKSFQSKGYLAQTTGLLTSGTSGSSPVGAGATLTPGTVETGFSLSVLPSVQPDGHRLLLQVMLSLSSLDSLLTVESGGQSIQVPTVSGHQLMPRAWMRSGQSLVLAGFEDDQATKGVSTPFGEHTWFLGGSRKVGTANTAVVIVITPIVTSNQNAI